MAGKKRKTLTKKDVYKHFPPQITVLAEENSVTLKMIFEDYNNEPTARYSVFDMIGCTVTYCRGLDKAIDLYNNLVKTYNKR